MEQPNGSTTEISEDIVQPILCQVVQDIPSHNQLDGMAEEHEEDGATTAIAKRLFPQKKINIHQMKTQKQDFYTQSSTG